MTTVKPSVGDRYGYALLQFEDRQYYMKVRGVRPAAGGGGR